MSDLSRLDSILRDVLAERAGDRAPAALHGTILAALDAELRVATAPVQLKRPHVPRRPFLVLAAALVVGALALGQLSAGHPSDRLAASPSAHRTPGESVAPSGVAVAPSASGNDGCPPMDELAQAGHEGDGQQPWPQPELSTRNGDIVTLAGDPAELERINLTANKPTLAPITTWGLRSFAVNRFVPSYDGRAVAVEIGFKAACSDIVVVNADGSSFRRPFLARLGDRVSGATWSPDNSFLAAVVGRSNSSNAMVQEWHPGTGAIIRLGEPCARCELLGPPVWDPANTLAALYVDRACVPSDDARCSPGLAFFAKGEWRTVVSPQDMKVVVQRFSPSDGSVTLLGWQDGGLEIAIGGTVLRVPIDGATSTPGDPIVTKLQSMVRSPDGNLIAGLTSNDTTFTGVAVLDLRTRTVRQVMTGSLDLVEFAWSPDSMSLAINSVGPDGRQLRTVGVDGTGMRVVSTVPVGAIAWLPAR